MMNTYSNSKNDKLIPYLCKFQLYIHQLQAQLFFPSSFHVSWRTKDNDELASTSGFNLKNQLNHARFDQLLQAQTIMLYNKQTKSYLDKDTIIIVKYYLNSKPNQIKELGKITLNMNRYVQQYGDSTVRKGQTNFKQLQNNNHINKNTAFGTKAKSPRKNKLQQQSKCLKLQCCQYNAKLRFKCQLVQSSISKLSLSSISPQQFNQPIQINNNNNKKSGPQPPKPKSSVNYVKTKDSLKQDKKQISIKKINQNPVPQNNSQLSTFSQNQKQQLKQSIHSQNTKPSMIQESLIIPSTLNQPQKNQNQQKLFIQLQHLQKQNLRLSTLCEQQKSIISQQQQLLKQLKNTCYQLQDEIKQKQLYFENNYEKLQKLDHIRYQLIQMKDYANKLQQRLTQIYKQKPQTLKMLYKSATGLRQSILKLQKKGQYNNQEQDGIKMSSITLIDQSFQASDQKGMSQSVSHIRQTNRNNQSKVSIPQNLYMLSASQIQLTNSQMRQIQGSTVRMQHQLSFMQMELYQVKAEVNFQQQKYQTQCIHHSQTKMELFNTQQKLKIVQKQRVLLQKQLEIITQECNQMHQQIQQLRQQILKLQQKQSQTRKQMFKLRESKQQQQYQQTITIKQQKIQLQSLREQAIKLQQSHKLLQQQVNSSNKRLQIQGQQCMRLKNELTASQGQIRKLTRQAEQFQSKQSQANEYLQNLQNEVSDIHKIMQDKQINVQQLQQQLLRRQQVIQKRQNEINQLQNLIKSLQMSLDNNEKQLALQRVRFSSISQIDKVSSNGGKSPRQRQTQYKITLLQSSNRQLIQKNKQLISIVNKNANSLISYEKHKKQMLNINELKSELSDRKRQNTKLQQINKKIQKQLQKITLSKQLLQHKYNQQKRLITEQKDNLLKQIKIEKQKNNEIYRLRIKQKQQTNRLQNKLLQKQRKYNDSQIKINQLYKQRKLALQTHKLLQSKNKNYQSLLIQQQSTILSNQSTIKQLQHKLKSYQTYTYQIGTHSLKTSFGGDGMSQIKLQSEIQDSYTYSYNNERKKSLNNFIINSNNNNSNSNNNSKSLKKQQNRHQSISNKQSRQLNNQQSRQWNSKQQQQITKQQNNRIKSLLTQIDTLKQQLQQYKSKQNNNQLQTNNKQQSNHINNNKLINNFNNKLTNNNKLTYNKPNNNIINNINNIKNNKLIKKQQKTKTQSLIKMIQSYLLIKTQSINNHQITQIFDKLHSFKQDKQYQNIYSIQQQQQINNKIQQIYKQIYIYKTKLLKSFKNTNQSSINSILQPIKPIQNKLHQLNLLTQNINKTNNNII